MKYLGFIIKKLRLFHGDKQKELAESVGISSAYLSEMEAGKKQPSIDLVNKIAERYRIFGWSIIRLAQSWEADLEMLISESNKTELIWQWLEATDKDL